MSDSVMTKFFDEGAYTALFAGKEGTVKAAFGSVNGCPVYCVEQNGGAMNAKETEKMIKVLDLAVKTGNPIVTCSRVKSQPRRFTVPTAKSSASIHALPASSTATARMAT